MTTMTAKRAALAAYVLALLQAHDARFRIQTEVQNETRYGSDASAVRRLMGSPILYAECLYVGDSEEEGATKIGIGGRAIEVGNTFVINVWREIATGSQALFDEIWNGGTGVTTTLWQTRHLTVSGRAAAVSEPSSIQSYEVAVIEGGATPVMAHYGTLEITIT